MTTSLNNTYITTGPWSHHFPQTYKQPAAQQLADTGAIRYRDEYGVITECTWEKLGVDQYNFILVVKQPGVYGRPLSRIVDDKKTFVEGIITTTQQIIQISDGEGYTIVGEYIEQEVAYFVENDPCVSYVAPFANYNNHIVTEGVGASSDLEAWDTVVWSDETWNTSAAMWIDVWGPVISEPVPVFSLPE